MTTAEPIPGPDRRSEILDIAAELFDAKGYSVTTLNDITAPLGFTRAALYYYFRSKQEILVALVDEAEEALLTMIRTIEASNLPPTEALRRIIRSYVEIATRDRHIVGVYLAERASLPPAHQQRLVRGEQEFVSSLARVVEAGIAAGEFQKVPPQPAALLLVGMVCWAQRWYKPTGELGSEDVADLIFSFFIAGLRHGWTPTMVPLVRRRSKDGRPQSK